MRSPTSQGLRIDTAKHLSYEQGTESAMHSPILLGNIIIVVNSER